MLDYSDQDVRRIEWEVLYRVGSDTVIHTTLRLKVPGGWLVNDWRWYEDKNKVESNSSSTVFFPDPNHKWEIEKK